MSWEDILRNIYYEIFWNEDCKIYFLKIIKYDVDFWFNINNFVGKYIFIFNFVLRFN